MYLELDPNKSFKPLALFNSGAASMAKCADLAKSRLEGHPREAEVLGLETAISVLGADGPKVAETESSLEIVKAVRIILILYWLGCLLCNERLPNISISSLPSLLFLSSAPGGARQCDQ